MSKIDRPHRSISGRDIGAGQRGCRRVGPAAKLSRRAAPRRRSGRPRPSPGPRRSGGCRAVRCGRRPRSRTGRRRGTRRPRPPGAGPGRVPVFAATRTPGGKPEASRVQKSCRAISSRTIAQAAGGPASSRQIRPSSRVSSRAVLDVVCAGSKTRIARIRSGGSVGKIRAKSASVRAPDVGEHRLDQLPGAADDPGTRQPQLGGEHRQHVRADPAQQQVGGGVVADRHGEVRQVAQRHLGVVGAAGDPPAAEPVARPAPAPARSGRAGRRRPAGRTPAPAGS